MKVALFFAVLVANRSKIMAVIASMVFIVMMLIIGALDAEYVSDVVGFTLLIPLFALFIGTSALSFKWK
jgi:hypothetical protein